MMALQGIKVLDVALHYPGPLCSMLLADLGADVLKIEQPEMGDPSRRWPSFFNSLNRNKRSFTLDYKRPEGKRIFYELVERYDVMTEGFRPGVTRKFGIDFENLHAINPRLVYCSISGYGQYGPYRDLPGHDLNYQAMSGMLNCFVNEDGMPVYPKMMISDQTSGMFAALGIVTALLARERLGQGQYIDCSMFDGLVFCMAPHLHEFFTKGEMITAPDPAYGTFRTADGKHLTLGIAYEDWFWVRLCEALGFNDLKDLKAVERKKRQKELTQKIQSVLHKRKRDELVEMFIKADVPVGPVKELEEVVRDPQIVAREMIQEISLTHGEKLHHVAFPIKLSATPAQIRMPPPTLGAHTEEVLKELGYDKVLIETLKKERIV